MKSRARVWAAALAVAAIGCSSADGQTAPSVPAALRARSLGGTDLGFAYDLETAWSFSLVGGTSTVTIAMVLLKEQPAGAASPVLLYRSILSGSPLPCARYYDGADCSGTVTVQPTQTGSVCVSGGRMFRPDFTGTPAAISYLSAEFPRWDPAALAFVVECVNVPGTTMPIVLPAIDAGPVGASPGRIYVEPAD